MTELPAGDLAFLARARGRKRHDHLWIGSNPETVCSRGCGLTVAAFQDRQRRGRLNRSRGNAIERGVAKELGLTRVGMYGGAEDAGKADEPFVASVKSGSGYFSERYWQQIRRLTVNALQTPILVVTDAPGPGHKRRAYVVMDIEDFRALHGDGLVGRIG